MENINTNNIITWEEKNLTEIKQNCGSNPMSVPNDTTNEIKVESVKKECEDIGNEKKWIRNCPTCNKKILYKNIKSFKRASGLNNTCLSCGSKNKPKRSKEFYKKIAFNRISPENKEILLKHPNLEKKCPNCENIIKYKNNCNLYKSVKNGILCKKCVVKRGLKENKYIAWNKNKKLSNDFREKIKKSWEKSRKYRSGVYHYYYNKKGPMFGKHHTEETKYKQRIAHINHLKTKCNSDKFIPNYSRLFCEYSNIYNKKYNVYIQHAENGGEKEYRGFFADGYISQKNIWIEYDEKRHYVGDILKKEDAERQLEIENHLKCKFIRIKICNTYDEFESVLLKLL